MSNDLQHFNNFVIFKTKAGKVNIDVFFKDENLWLTQKKMSELFEVEVNTINYHLKEIFKSGELTKEATIRKIGIVQKEGNRDVMREVEFHNLKVILTVGYRDRFLKENRKICEE